MSRRYGSIFQGICRFSRDRSAGPIVEFALVVPILSMLVLGIVDFGRAYFVRNALVSAVREGARLASVQPTDPCSAKATIRARVIAAFAPVGGAELSDTESMIPVSCTMQSGRVATITVSVVGYPFTPITGIFTVVGLPSTLTLSATATFRWELAS